MEVIGRKIKATRTSIEALLNLDKNEKIKSIYYDQHINGSYILFETYYFDED